MSEFGRTARENGNRGTDHGHANVMFVLGGPVKGGKVYGRWPGLDPSQLYEGRDLALTTDFRQVVGEAVARHMGNKNLNAVFPGYENQPSKFLRLLDSAAAGRRPTAVGFCRDHLQRRESSSPCQPKCDQQKHYRDHNIRPGV